MALVLKDDNTMSTTDVSMVVIGHVDAGKSSLSGQLLYASNTIDQRKLDKLKVEADRMNRGTFFLAHTMDTNPEEKSRGITITTNTKQFITPGKKRKITLVDAPGHRDFINNMLAGAAQCNAALLVISAIGSEFRAGIDSTGQTLEHTLLVNALGVNKIIVAVNKMDADSVQWAEAKFTEIKDEMLKQYRKLGGKVANIQFVPISGFKGVNITSIDNEKTPWYKGKCLMDLIDDWPEVTHNLEVPFRMSVSGVCKVAGAGQIFTGKVYTGKAKPGDSLECAPNECKAIIKTIEKFHKPAEVAYPDDSIGMAIKGRTPDNIIPKKGDLMGAAGTGLERVWRFEGMVMLTAPLRNEIGLGFKPVITAHVAKVACTLVKLVSIKERKTGREVIEERQTLRTGDRFVAHFQPEKGNLCIEVDKKFGLLTRFVIRNSNTTMGVGQAKKRKNDEYEANFRPPSKAGDKKEKKEGGKEKKGKKK